jgi:hypothetical protein
MESSAAAYGYQQVRGLHLDAVLQVVSVVALRHLAFSPTF